MTPFPNPTRHCHVVGVAYLFDLPEGIEGRKLGHQTAESCELCRLMITSSTLSHPQRNFPKDVATQADRRKGVNEAGLFDRLSAGLCVLWWLMPFGRP